MLKRWEKQQLSRQLQGAHLCLCERSVTSLWWHVLHTPEIPTQLSTARAGCCLHQLGSKWRRKCCLQPFWHSHSNHSWSVTDTSFKSRLHTSVFKVGTGIMQQLHLVWDCKQKSSIRERQTILSLVKQHFMVVRVSLEYDLGWIVLFQERSV